MKIKPRLEKTIASLQAKIASFYVNDKDENILRLVVNVAAEKILVNALFGPLFCHILAFRSPDTSFIVSDLTALMDHCKASKQRKEKRTSERRKSRCQDGRVFSKWSSERNEKTIKEEPLRRIIYLCKRDD